MSNRIFVCIRIVLGCLYIVSGFEKLLTPYQNFVYVIQGYDVLRNPYLEEIVARTFPWLELITGAFLLLGLWTRFAVIGLAAFSATFIVIVGQAILRDLGIQECGCFGDLGGLPLEGIIMMDIAILCLAGLMLYNLSKTLSFSLDRYFSKKK